MFDRPTVFVVGAGASKEVRLPIGAELTTAIASKLHVTFQDGWSQSTGDRVIADAVKWRLEREPQRDPNPFYQAGRAIAAAMPQAISIDNFLHTHSDDPRLVLMGKLGIAKCILEAEAKSDLQPRDNGSLLDFHLVQKTWFTTFFQMLTEGVTTRNLDGIFDSVAFITFNYDRCIEHYLTHALMNYFRMSRTDAEQLVATLEIVHPYGQVGKFSWQQPNGSVQFGQDVHHQELPAIAGQIRTFTEQVEDETRLETMRSLISESDVLVYLGFSFGSMNMKLLSVEESAPKAVFGTSYGLSEQNVAHIRNDVLDALGPKYELRTPVALADMTSHDFLQRYWRPIQRGSL